MKIAVPHIGVTLQCSSLSPFFFTNTAGIYRPGKTLALELVLLSRAHPCKGSERERGMRSRLGEGGFLFKGGGTD